MGDMNSLQTLEPEVEASCCVPAEKPALGAEEAQQKALIFKALADPNRLRLLSIVKAGESGSPASVTSPNPWTWASQRSPTT